MKRTFKLAVIAALSLTAYANILMPEISRNAKNKNTSIMAVSQDIRSFIAADYTSIGLETDTSPSIDIDVATKSFYGASSGENFSFEGEVLLVDTEVGSTSNDTRALRALFGYRASKTLTFGAGVVVEEVTTTADDVALEFGGTLEVNGTILGATYKRHSLDDIFLEGSYDQITLAFGAQNKTQSWETGIIYTGEGSDSYIVGTRLGIFAGATKFFNDVEVNVDFLYDFGDYDRTVVVGDNDYKNIVFSLSAEYLFGGSYYVTPGIEFSSLDVENDNLDTEQSGISALLGYRASGLDANVGLVYVLSGKVAGIDTDGLGFNVNVGYAF